MTTQSKLKVPVKAHCNECGKETISGGRKPRHLCPSTRVNGKQVYSACQLAYWARWKKANRQKKYYEKGGKYYYYKKVVRVSSVGVKPVVGADKEKRICLGVLCAEEEEPQYFLSTGIFHRVCDKCRTASENYNTTRVAKVGRVRTVSRGA
jgi:hypothetical protein